MHLHLKLEHWNLGPSVFEDGGCQIFSPQTKQLERKHAARFGQS